VAEEERIEEHEECEEANAEKDVAKEELNENVQKKQCAIKAKKKCAMKVK